MSAIWFNKESSIDDIPNISADTMAGYLGMEWIEIGPSHLKMRMPVNNRTIQPYGILHGGASCALAETIGSLASHLVIDPSTHYCVGLEINANHIRSAREGFIIAHCTPIHLGRSTHVWDIKIEDEARKLVCVSRLTVAILNGQPR